MNLDNLLDVNFKANPREFIRWKCKECSQENKNLIKDVFQAANLSITACYDCGKLNVIDLKTDEVV